MSNVKVCDWLLNGVMCCDDGSRCRFLDHQEECPMSRFDGDEEETPAEAPAQSAEEPLGCGNLWNGMCMDTDPIVKCEAVDTCRIREELEKLNGELETPSVSEANSSPMLRTGEPLDDAAADREMKVVYLPVELIEGHPDNPRKSELDVEELAASIKAEGIQQPLTVVPHIGGYEGRYTCVIGHRRLAAAKKAGMAAVPAFIRTMDRREQLRTMMTENTQRRDLTPLEQADGFKQLMLELPEQTAAAVARETGFSETTVRRRLRLHELPREAVEIAEERGNVTLADYEELNRIKDPERRAKAAEELGNPNFRGEVERQVAAEKRDEKFDALVQKLVNKGVGVVDRATGLYANKDYEYMGGVRSWQLDNPSLPTL